MKRIVTETKSGIYIEYCYDEKTGILSGIQQEFKGLWLTETVVGSVAVFASLEPITINGTEYPDGFALQISTIVSIEEVKEN